METGECSLVFYFDFLKGFDTRNHILFVKSSHYGIRGTALNWLQRYHRQSVSVFFFKAMFTNITSMFSRNLDMLVLMNYVYFSALKYQRWTVQINIPLMSKSHTLLLF